MNGLGTSSVADEDLAEPVELGLDEAFEALIADTASKELQGAYLNAFPASFAEMKAELGFDESDSGEIHFGPFYDNSEEFVRALFELVTDSIGLARKAVTIASAGAWQADGVSHYQHHLIKSMHRWPYAYSAALDALEPKALVQYWSFCFDGPEPPTSDAISAIQSAMVGHARSIAVIDSIGRTIKPNNH